MVDVGYDAKYIIFVIYNEAGCSAKAKKTNEAILAAVRAETYLEQHVPTFIVGDFNAEPETYDEVKELNEEEWVDVGINAHWWQRERAQSTCQNRAGAKPSRIDAILVTRRGLLNVHDVRVEKDTMIPTHHFVIAEVSKSCMIKEKRFAKTISSLRKQYGMPLQKLRRWWQGKMSAQHPVGDAAVCVFGHYHHLQVLQDGPRTLLGCPSNDGGSRWFEESGGPTTACGTLTFTCDVDGWDDLKVL